MPKASAPDRAVRGGMAVAADDDHAGLAQALLGPDHVHDALPPVVAGRTGSRRSARVMRLEVLDHAERRLGSLIADRSRPSVET